MFGSLEEPLLAIFVVFLPDQSIHPASVLRHAGRKPSPGMLTPDSQGQRVPTKISRSVRLRPISMDKPVCRGENLTPQTLPQDKSWLGQVLPPEISLNLVTV